MTSNRERHDQPVSALGLSTHTQDLLRASGITTIDQLCQRSAEELLDGRDFGESSLQELCEQLAVHGLQLRNRPHRHIPAPAPPAGTEGLGRLAVMGVAFAVASLLVRLDRGKIVPGGPFLSVSSELVPIVLFLAVIGIGVASIRKGSFEVRGLIICLLFYSTCSLAFVLERIILFWFRPYARGDLFGP